MRPAWHDRRYCARTRRELKAADGGSRKKPLTAARGHPPTHISDPTTLERRALPHTGGVKPAAEDAAALDVLFAGLGSGSEVDPDALAGAFGPSGAATRSALTCGVEEPVRCGDPGGVCMMPAPLARSSNSSQNTSGIFGNFGRYSEQNWMAFWVAVWSAAAASKHCTPKEMQAASCEASMAAKQSATEVEVSSCSWSRGVTCSLEAAEETS